MTKKERMEQLSRVRLFSDLSGRDLQLIVDASKVVSYDEGDTIITEGESGVGFQLILEGEARVARSGRTLAKLGPGDFFGEMALIDQGPRTADVIAATPLSCLAIASWDFRPLVKSRPGMAWALLVHLAGRIRDDQKREDALRA